MSFYNMLFGKNPLADWLVQALDVHPARFRDAWLAEEDGKLVIAIHTRTGGGNRECYADGEDHSDCYHHANEAMEAHPLYLRDEDDDFDCTYATFYFSSPPELEPVLRRFLSDQPETPAEKWESLLADLQKAEPETERGRHALTVGKAMLAPIVEKLGESK